MFYCALLHAIANSLHAYAATVKQIISADASYIKIKTFSPSEIKFHGYVHIICKV